MSDFDGYAWLNSWQQPFEGSLSLLLKFAWANAATASDTCQDHFDRKVLSAMNVKRQGRSLLDLSWASAGGAESSSYLKTMSVRASLATLAERWTFLIASDMHIRYCARCIGEGFHSSIYQIDALQKCPIHRESLLSVCNHCGGATSTHAISKETFENPFHCVHCGSHIGIGDFDPKQWGNQSLRLAAAHALAPFASWLQRLVSAGIRWDRWEDWGLPLKHLTSEAERRKSTVRVLASLVSPDFDTDLFGATWSGIPTSFGLKVRREPRRRLYSKVSFSDNEIRERQLIYKSLRRQLEKQFGKLFKDVPDANGNRWKDYTYNEVFSPKKDVCLFSLAVLFWRFRIEDHSEIAGGPTIRLPVLNWPQDGTADKRAWAGFLLASFRASVGTLSAWTKRAKEFTDSDLFGSDRVKARELYSEFAPAFDLARLPILPGVSVVEFDIGSDQAQLAVFGPSECDLGHVLSNCSATLCRCSSKVPLATRNLTGGMCTADSHAIEQMLLPPADIDVWKQYIRPLEDLVLPPELSGASRVSTMQHLEYRLQSVDDIEAINAYLTSENFSKSTVRAYRQHIEKCLIWSVAQLHKPLSSLTSEDARAYCEFLANPKPQEIWLHRARALRRTKDWSPFKIPLAARSRDFSIGIVSNLFSWWESRMYVEANPWRHMPFQVVGSRQYENAPVKSVSISSRVMPHVDWLYIRQALSQVPDPDQAISLELALFLSYYESLKPSEIGAIQADQIEFINAQAGEGLWRVPVPSREMQRRWIYLLPPVIDNLCRALKVEPENLTRKLEKNGPCRLVNIVGRVFYFPESNEMEVDPTDMHRYLYTLTKPLFRLASILAATAGDGAAAARLRSSSLVTLSQAYEEHVQLQLRETAALWHLTGARRLIVERILQYAQPREMRPPNELMEDILFIAPTFHLD